jgi:hypothetical protein
MKNKTEDLVLPILINALLLKDLLAAPLTLNSKPPKAPQWEKLFLEDYIMAHQKVKHAHQPILI